MFKLLFYISFYGNNIHHLKKNLFRKSQYPVYLNRYDNVFLYMKKKNHNKGEIQFVSFLVNLEEKKPKDLSFVIIMIWYF